MDDVADLKPHLTAMLMGSVFEPYASDYSSKLIKGRYSATTRRVYERCVGHFARWLGAERIGLEGVNEEAGRRFVTEHLPRCDCPPPVRRSPHDNKAALSHLFDLLTARGVLVAPSGSTDHMRCEIPAFDHYMDAVCGLAAKTRRQRLLFLTRFLTTRFGSGPIVATAITATDLRKFVVGVSGAARHGARPGDGRCVALLPAVSGDCWRPRRVTEWDDSQACSPAAGDAPCRALQSRGEATPRFLRWIAPVGATRLCYGALPC